MARRAQVGGTGDSFSDSIGATGYRSSQPTFELGQSHGYPKERRYRVAARQFPFRAIQIPAAASAVVTTSNSTALALPVVDFASPMRFSCRKDRGSLSTEVK